MQAEQTRGLVSGVIIREESGVRLDLKSLRTLPTAAQGYTLRQAVAEVQGHLEGIYQAHIEQLLRLIRTRLVRSGAICPAGLWPHKGYNTLEISRNPAPSQAKPLTIP